MDITRLGISDVKIWTGKSAFVNVLYNKKNEWPRCIESATVRTNNINTRVLITYSGKTN